MTDNELYHFGILGQKWGIRRFQNPDGSLTEEGKRRYGTGIFRRAKPVVKREKPKSARQTAATLSDDELRKAISRMQLELSYVDAMNRLNPQPAKSKKGHPILREFAKVGEGMAKKLLEGVGDVMVSSLKKAFSDDEKADDKYARAKKEKDYWLNLNTLDKQKEEYETRHNTSSAKSSTAPAESIEKGKKVVANVMKETGYMPYSDAFGNTWIDDNVI